MQVAQVVANQVLVMFLLIGIGVVCDRFGITTPRGIKQMSTVLMYMVAPSLIITSYQRDYSPEGARRLLICVGMAVLTHMVGILVSTLLFRKNERLFPNDRHRMARFASVYSNAGFMGYPVLMAVMGSEGIFYGVAYVAIFMLFNWTHGVLLLKGQMDWKAAKSVLVNPGIIGVTIGLLLYFTQLRLPGPVNTVLDYMGSLNTPVAMIVIGSYVSRVNWWKTLRTLSVYLVSAVRLLLIPVLMLCLFGLFGLRGELLLAVLIPASCPVAAVASIFATRFGGDALYGSELVAFSTVFSLVTLPVMVFLAALLFP